MHPSSQAILDILSLTLPPMTNSSLLHLTWQTAWCFDWVLSCQAACCIAPSPGYFLPLFHLCSHKVWPVLSREPKRYLRKTWKLLFTPMIFGTWWNVKSYANWLYDIYKMIRTRNKCNEYVNNALWYDLIWFLWSVEYDLIFMICMIFINMIWYS